MLESRIPDSDRLRGTVRRGWRVENETTIDEGIDGRCRREGEVIRRQVC